MFSPNSTMQPVPVEILNDNDFEGNEIFNLTVNTTALPYGIHFKEPEACVTIADDECEYYSTHIYLSHMILVSYVRI